MSWWLLKIVFFYFFLFIFNVYMQPYGYDRPSPLYLPLLMPGQRPLSFLHFRAVSPPLLPCYRSAFGLVNRPPKSLKIVAVIQSIYIQSILISN